MNPPLRLHAPPWRCAVPLFFSIAAALFSTPLARTQAATVVFDGGSGGTGNALEIPANWAGDTLPDATSEVLLNNSVITLPAQLTINTANVAWGNLIWNTNASGAITMNTTAATNRNITLGGASGSAEAIAQGGATGDLFLLGSSATTNTVTIGGNAGTGSARLNLALAASGNFNVLNSGATLNILSLISGAYSITKTGAGTLTLSGANSFSGGFTLNSGTVNINSASALGASSNTFVINGGTFDNTSGAAITTSNYKQTWNGDFTFTGTQNLALGTGTVSLGTAAGTSRTVTVAGGMLSVTGVISNGTTATGLIKNGAGNLVLGASNTFNGGVTIKAGTVTGNASAAFGATAGAITLGDTSGSSNASLLGGGTASITVANPIVVAAGSSANVLTIGSGSGASTTTFTGPVSLGHDVVLMSGGVNMVALTGVVSETGGARAITVNAGSGTVQLSNSNTFSGGVTLNNGRLLVGNNSTGSGAFTIAGGVLDTISTSGTSAATLTNSSYVLNGDLLQGGSTAITLDTGNVLLTGNRTITTNTITAAGLTVRGAITDGGNGHGFTKAGTASLTLTGNSTYSGETIVTRGTLNLTSAGSGLASTSGVTVTGGTLTVGATSGTGVANRINAAASLTLGGSGVFVLSAGATGPVNSQSFAALAVIEGSSQIGTSNSANAGTFTFTGPAASVYSRSVGGTLRILLGSNTTFMNAPTGAGVSGSGTNAILIGAVTGSSVSATAMTDFVKAASGAVTAATYGTNVWSAGTNTTVTAPLTVSGSTQSLRFNATASPYVVTLNGSATLESGGILVTSNATAGGSITGGQLQAAAGKDLWAYVSTAATNPQGLTIASVIADNAGSSLTKAGPGMLYLTNPANTYAGGTYLGEGTLNVTTNGALGTGALNFTGNATLQAGAASVDLGTRPITIANGQTATFNAGAGNTLTVAGVISGSGGLLKNGAGTLVLSGASTYAGPTAIENGTLKLDFSAVGAPVNDILPATSLLTPGGGSFLAVGAFNQTVIVQGKAATANSQTFGGTYTSLAGYDIAGVFLNRGMTHLNFLAGDNGGTLTVNVGTVTRGYSTDSNNSVDFKIGERVTVLSSAPNGNLGGYATVNGESWATVSAGQLTGLATASYSTNYAAAGVLDVGSGGTLSANPTLLRFNNAGAATVSLGNVVRSVSLGGVLVTANVGASTSTISGGFLSGFSARDLVLHQHNTAGDLVIAAPIVDINARTMTVAKNGAGRAVLTGSHFYSGSTFVNEGTLMVTGDAVASFTRMATATGASPVLAMSDTSGIFLGQAVTEATALATSSTTWTVIAINPGVSVTLSAPASESLSGGTFTFGAGGALGGATAQYIAPGARLQIGDGGTTGSLLPAQTLSNNGTVVVNRSDNLTFSNVISGTGAFEKQGAGTLTLGGSQSFTGDIRIAGGTLIPAAAATLQNGTLDYNGYGGTFSFGSLPSATLGGLKGSQNLVLTNAAAAAVSLTIGGNHQDTTYAGSLSGLGSISKTGGGILTLSGSHTYAGTTSLAQGTTNLTGTFTDTGTLSVTGGVTNLSGSFLRTGSYTTAVGLSVSGGVFNVTGTLGTSAALPLAQTAFSGNSITNFSGTVFLSGASSTFRIADPSSATVNVTGGTVTVGSSSAGVVLGRSNSTASGVLNVTGGSFVVTGNSTVVRVGAGYVDSESSGPSILSISGTGIFTTGTTTGTILLGSNLAGNTTSSGTLNLDSGGTLTTNRTVVGGSVGASVFNFNGGTFKATGTTATLGTSLGTVNVRNGGAVIDSNGFNIAIAEPLVHSTIGGDNAIDGGVTKQGTGTLTLSGANTYTGATAVSGGTLKAGSSTPFGSNSAVTVADAAGTTLDITGFDVSIGSLAGGGAAGGQVSLGAATLTTGANQQSTTYAGIISGTGGGLVKTGSGTMALAGVNTYTGTTTINDGNLQAGVGGVGTTGTGAVSINGAGAMLSGTGVVQGSASVILGQLRPGDNGGAGEGTLAFANGLAFKHATTSNAAALTIQGTNALNETGDRLSITGALSLDGDSLFTVSSGANWTPTQDQSWTLLDWSGVLTLNGWSTGTNFRTGSNADLNEGNLDLPDLSAYNLGWNISTLEDGSSGGTLIITIVPEPSRVVLVLVGVGSLLLRRRRR